MHIGERLRQERLSRGWTLDEVAARAGYSSSGYLSEIERGNRLNIERVVAILNKLLALYNLEAVVEVRAKGGDVGA